MISRPLRTHAVLALCCIVALLAGCTAATTAKVADPAAEAVAYAAAWQQGDLLAAAALTTDSAAAAQLLRQTEQNLSPSAFTVEPGAITRTSDDAATSTAKVTWTLGEAGDWSYDVSWDWVIRDGRWWLMWTPTVVHPQLGAQQGLVARLTKATNGSIVDRNDVQIVNPTTVYSIIALKSKIPDIPGVAASLFTLLSQFDPTLTAAGIEAGIAGSEPDQGYTVLNLREDSFSKVQQQLAGIAGISTPSEVRNLPPTRDFAKSLLGEVTPLANEMMTGKAGWRIATVDTTGAELTTLAEQPAVPGQKVTLTIDSATQQAADSTVATLQQPAAIVAIQPSTGEILAVAQNAAADAQGTIALTGQYPPGSIFKVITATAGIDVAGLTPASEVPCPGSWTVESRPISNSHGFDLGTVDLTLAFAKSCNTTFAQIAAGLSADALYTTAKQYGVGLDFDVQGIITLTGQSPVATSAVEQAENGFGQGKDLVSPFSAALVAATVANGAMPTPLLIRGSQTTVDEPAPDRSAAASDALPLLMAAVTAKGTGASLRSFGDIRLKTGTAEFTNEAGEIHAHAWTIGYLGDMAFAAFIAGGEDSTHTNELTGTFLSAALGR